MVNKVSSYRLHPLSAIGIALSVVLVIGIGYAIFQSVKDPNNFHAETTNGRIYYIFDGDYTGDYDIQNGSGGTDVQAIVDYGEYSKICQEQGFIQRYSDPSKYYAIYLKVFKESSGNEAHLAGITYQDDNITFYILEDYTGLKRKSNFIVVPVEKDARNLLIVDLVRRDKIEQ